MLKHKNTYTADPRLSCESIHDLLAARRRRYVLYCLHLYANPMRLRDIAGRISEWEHGAPETELLEEHLHIYTSLYHDHVPKLTDAGVITYSQAEDMLELTPNAAQVRPHLKRTAETELAGIDISS